MYNVPMTARHTPESLAATLARRSERVGDCLLWRGSTNKRFGYGDIGVGGKLMKVHRVAWALVNGPIPDGLFVLHTCDVRNCIEPTHLWLGTQTDNMRDAAAKGRLLRIGGWNKGHPHSSATLARITEAAQRRPRRPQTAETRAKIAAARRRQWADPTSWYRTTHPAELI